MNIALISSVIGFINGSIPENVASPPLVLHRDGF